MKIKKLQINRWYLWFFRYYKEEYKIEEKPIINTVEERSVRNIVEKPVEVHGATFEPLSQGVVGESHRILI